MAHTHPVHDTDAHFVIDPVTREIKNQSGKTRIVQHDHNCERFSFEIAKDIEGHSVTLCNSVQIHYINIDSATKAQNVGVYEVNDMQPSPNKPNVFVLTWLISNNATRYAGTLNFLVKFKCVADDGSVDYVWNSAVYKDITISSGMDNGEAIVEEHADILEQWRTELFDSEDSSPTIGEVELLAANWEGEANLYSQVVSIEGVTENSQVDLTPSVEQLVVFYEKDLTFVTENDGGIVTVYAIGQKPENDYTIQVTITEVSE